MLESITMKLREAEAEARTLVEGALRREDYLQARRVLDYAQSIRHLRDSIEAEDGPLRPPRRAREALPRKRPDARPYPHFFIEDDKLVKLGRSRPEAPTPFYRHETPRDIYDAILDIIRVNEGIREPWSVKSLEEPLRRQSIPAYHAYNVVGALREARLIEQIGRGLYHVAVPVPPGAWWQMIADLWPRDRIADEEVRRTEGDE